MGASSSTDQDYELWVLLRSASHAMFKTRERELSEYDITPVQARVLFIIQAAGNKATPAEIARQMLREPHTISALVSRMEKDGLVRKAKDLANKNLVRVELTKKGRQAYSQSIKLEPIHNIVSSLSEEERKYLKSSLEKLRDKALHLLGVNRKLFYS